MINRRSKLEIYIDILKEINNGVIIPTKIMYGANLSWKPLQQILKSLVNQELIEEFISENGDKRTKKAYNLTEKGINVLRYFNKAKELVENDRVPELRNWR
ncbi:MAG: helix-turn-helix transcriptional regulator [Candidatus Bathyarchaeota archaeon]|nr:helix-turn-helix transcriptional regulator [Candidatus Bathyarchaeota archaeon]